jgi:hypothetical protein
MLVTDLDADRRRTDARRLCAQLDPAEALGFLAENKGEKSPPFFASPDS